MPNKVKNVPACPYNLLKKKRVPNAYRKIKNLFKIDCLSGSKCMQEK